MTRNTSTGSGRVPSTTRPKTVPMTPLMTSLAEATLTPALFARTASRGRWKLVEHLRVLDRAITDTLVGADGCRRLMVFMPPRHGKSELCCKYLPPWYLGPLPEPQGIVCGYGGGFRCAPGRKRRGGVVGGGGHV